jgi:flagellar motor protein MotB
MNLTSTRLLFTTLILLAPGLTSCVSSRLHQQAITEKDSEIERLREERTSLKSQIQKLKGSLELAQGQLADASARVIEPTVKEEPARSNPELDALGIGVSKRDGHTVISIPAAITFASGQAALSKDGKDAIQKVSKLLRKEHAGMRYVIEGHTDDEPIKKSKFESNRDLSYARAKAVLEYLVTDCSIEDADCVIAAHGQYEPVATGKADKDKARNRRVEIVVMNR